MQVCIMFSDDNLVLLKIMCHNSVPTSLNFISTNLAKSALQPQENTASLKICQPTSKIFQ